MQNAYLCTYMKHHFLHTISILALLLIACSACKGTNAPEQPTLTVSIEPQRYLLQQIAGDRWHINTLLSKGADPENFDPALTSLKSLQDSRAYFTVGTIPFEETLISRLKPDSTLRIINTSSGIHLIEGTHHSHEHEHEHGHTHDTDPHVWSSIKNARIMARNMYQALIELDTDNADTYTRNYLRLDADLDSLDRELTRTLSPAQGDAFLVWHPSLSYFARDYSLHQIAMGMENKELSADAFRRHIDEVSGHNATIFFTQPEFDGNRSDNIVRQTGMKNIPVNTLTYDLPSELRRIATSITDAHQKANPI